MKKYRIAICFRGLIRTGIENRKTFSHCFEKLDWEVDYFSHTWNYENVAPPFLESPIFHSDLWKELRSRPTSVLTPFKISKFIKAYNLKKFTVQKFEDYRNLNNEEAKLPNDEFLLSFHPQFVSCYEANTLKREYEKEHGFKYDLVINTRPDLVINPSFVEKLTLTLLKITKTNHPYLGVVNLLGNWTYDDDFFDDVMYVAKSENIDRFCEYFNPNINISKHNFVGQHIRNVELELTTLRFDYAILRNYLSFFDPVEDYNHIFIGNLLMYYNDETIDILLKSNIKLQPIYERALNDFVS